MTMNQQPPPAPSVPIFPGRPPAGMIPAEADLLTLWVNQNYQEYYTIEYNVRVGHGVDPGPAWPQNIRDMNIANSQRRIDAVLTQGKRVLIVEVKVRGTLQAIGQLLGYRVLWMRDNASGGVPDLLLICATLDEDTAFAYRVLGVPYVVIPSGATSTV